MKQQVSVLVLSLLVASVTSSAIPIWELLTYEEKMGRLLYVFVHLVERYCKASSMADCRKVMTLHGVANLLNHDDYSLDLLDPDQRNSSRLIWQAAVKSQYKYPPEKEQETKQIAWQTPGKSAQTPSSSTSKHQFKYPAEKSSEQETKQLGLSTSFHETKAIMPRVMFPPPKYLWRTILKK